MDGEEIDSVSVGDGTNDNYSTAFTEVTACAGTLTQGCTIHFDDVDFDMGDGDTSHFIVKADVNEVDGSPVAEGDGLTVTLTDTDADNIDAEDVNGDSLSTELTGSATSDGVAFNTEGISVKLVGTPTAVISHAADLTLITDDDQATWTVTFDVTAFGDDMRIDDESAEDTAAPYTTASQMSYSLSDSSKIAASPASIVTSPSGATHDTESFLVEEGTTERFTLSVTGTAAADGYSNMKLEAISWLAGATDGAGTQVYNFNLDDYKTADIYVNQN
jgi:hypothetical protein